ncbi:hypothetical protein M422DRAFT_248295 [Sphaerobolus stellatus SS14]|uniref:Uncharacterized protein n=1 Tax=Sphaerobolus stellatus (strain SS14) TaxID=990650 RepID=A0A0C9VJF4_SPHS4|nr:hypothetical protein M422DRAFT_248295 [Sphaerobolus stellatus SS14]
MKMHPTFWKRKFLAPLWHSTFTQLIVNSTTSTIDALALPVSSAFTPTSLVPIQSVYSVSSAPSFNGPFFVSLKYVDSWLSKTEGNGREVTLLEQVAPDFAKENSWT